MKGPKAPKEELRDLCNRLLDGGDGDFSAVERDRLEALVLGDRELRRLYVEILHQHAALRQSATRLGDVPLSEIIEIPPAEPAPGARRFPRWPLQLAAGLVLAAVIWLFAPRPAEKSLATLVETNGARWDNSSLPTAPGSALRAGRLRLESGVARLVFQSGAEVSLEGPAELEIQGPNACFLHNGALTAHVPARARGFLVGTAHAQLIDHGTDFGISTDPDGQGQVQVLKGEVELRHETSGETRRLLVHQSATITAAHLAEAGGAEGEPDRYAFLRPSGAVRPPTLTLTTAGGTGDAAYVYSPGSPIHRSDTLLLLKNAPTKGYLRKAFLGFDLAPLHHRRVAGASLTLNFETTGFGYASLTDECTFAVYGLTDATQAGWTADTLTWQNAPAFAPGGGAVDSDKTVKLGTFTTPRGVVSGTFSITGQALTGFLNNSGASPRATLIVVRETSLPGHDSAVHGFAGNHHPTLAPPTLRLTLAER